MTDWTRRFALAALMAFFVFVVALPVSCGSLLLYSEHLRGDVQGGGGPAAILGGMACSGVLALLAGALVFIKTGRR